MKREIRLPACIAVLSLLASDLAFTGIEAQEPAKINGRKASPLAAVKQQKSGPDGRPRDYAKRYKDLRVIGGWLMRSGAGLTRAQWEKVETIDRMYADKWKELREETLGLLTVEQRARKQNADEANGKAGIRGAAAVAAVNEAIGYTEEQLQQLAKIQQQQTRIRTDALRLLVRVLPARDIQTRRLPSWFQKPFFNEFLRGVELTEFQRHVLQSVHERFRHIETQIEHARNQILTAEQTAAGNLVRDRATKDALEPAQIQKRMIAAQHRTAAQNVAISDMESLLRSLKRHAFGQFVGTLSQAQWQQLSAFPLYGPHFYPGGVALDLPYVNGVRLDDSQVAPVKEIENWYSAVDGECFRQRFALPGGAPALDDPSVPATAPAEPPLSGDAINRIHQRARDRVARELATILTQEQITALPKLGDANALGDGDGELSTENPVIAELVRDLDLSYSQQIRTQRLDGEYGRMFQELTRQRSLLTARLNDLRTTTVPPASVEDDDTSPPSSEGPLAEELANTEVPQEDGQAESSDTTQELRHWITEIDSFRGTAVRGAIVRLQTILTPEQIARLPAWTEPVTEPENKVEPSLNTVEQFFDSDKLTADQQSAANELNQKFSARYQALARQSETVLTEAQKNAAKKAETQARQAGLTEQEIQDRVHQAMLLTTAQMFSLTQIDNELKALDMEFLEALKGILTDEQQGQIRIPRELK